MFIFEKSPQMMILKNKLCGSASSAGQGLSDPTVSDQSVYISGSEIIRNRGI